MCTLGAGSLAERRVRDVTVWRVGRRLVVFLHRSFSAWLFCFSVLLLVAMRVDGFSLSILMRTRFHGCLVLDATFSSHAFLLPGDINDGFVFLFLSSLLGASGPPLLLFPMGRWMFVNGVSCNF